MLEAGIGSGMGRFGGQRRRDRVPAGAVLEDADLRAYTLYLWEAEGCVGRWLGRVRVHVREVVQTFTPYELGRLANGLCFNARLADLEVAPFWGYFLTGDLAARFGEWLKFQRALAALPLSWWYGEGGDRPPAGVFGGACLPADVCARLEEQGNRRADFAHLGNRNLQTWAGELLAAVPDPPPAPAPVPVVFDRTAWRRQEGRRP